LRTKLIPKKMENGNSNKRKFRERQKKAKQRANQTPEKIQESRAADLRNKARAIIGVFITC
jgi:hypothetical protein